MSNARAKPFKVAVPDADIDLLQKKLALVRFPDELEGAGWDYGSPLADMKRLTAHWKDKFDWRKAEAGINTLPMFTRDIEVDGFGTLNVHFVHQVSDVRNAIPLLFVHGCEWMSGRGYWREILITASLRAWYLPRGEEDPPSADGGR